MNKEPIIKFENKEQAEKCLKEWQHRLFLDDWVIKINLVDCIEDEENCMGRVDYRREYLVANVRIKKELNEETIEKLSHEKILIHELLHLVIPQTDNYETIQDLYWNENQHQIIEKMARSLFMAKYNLPFEWFTESEDEE